MFPYVSFKLFTTLSNKLYRSDFEPSAASTRLKSEEFYRERVGSDSLFTAGSGGIDRAGNNQQHNETSSYTAQDDVFDNDDLFGPPPLPDPKIGGKTPNKSKVSSLFDDFQDSDDDLFPETSFLNTKSSKADSSKFNKNISTSSGLFDEQLDIFGVENNQDLFPAESTSNDNNLLSKPINLFDDKDDDEDDDLFGTKSLKIHQLSDDKPKGSEMDDVKEDQSFHGSEGKMSSGNGLFSTTPKAHGLLFEDENYDDLFDSKNTTNDISDNANPDMNESVAADKEIHDSEDQTDPKILSEVSEEVDGISNDKVSPPLTLNCDDNNQQPARRAVSGKIQNLMGKMGGLKIRSPTDPIPKLIKPDKKTNEADDSDDASSLSKSRTPPSVSGKKNFKITRCRDDLLHSNTTY